MSTQNQNTAPSNTHNTPTAIPALLDEALTSADLAEEEISTGGMRLDAEPAAEAQKPERTPRRGKGRNGRNRNNKQNDKRPEQKTDAKQPERRLINTGHVKGAFAYAVSQVIRDAAFKAANQGLDIFNEETLSNAIRAGMKSANRKADEMIRQNAEGGRFERTSRFLVKWGDKLEQPLMELLPPKYREEGDKPDTDNGVRLEHFHVAVRRYLDAALARDDARELAPEVLKDAVNTGFLKQMSSMLMATALKEALELSDAELESLLS